MKVNEKEMYEWVNGLIKNIVWKISCTRLIANAHINRFSMLKICVDNFRALSCSEKKRISSKTSASYLSFISFIFVRLTLSSKLLCDKKILIKQQNYADLEKSLPIFWTNTHFFIILRTALKTSFVRKIFLFRSNPPPTHTHFVFDCVKESVDEKHNDIDFLE